MVVPLLAREVGQNIQHATIHSRNVSELARLSTAPATKMLEKAPAPASRNFQKTAQAPALAPGECYDKLK